ncbi:MAG: 30S ribosomal protein S11 [Candidatus Liptonbacteria bacterium RIFCSPHIGHO2_01_FULL_57_28]|uniref:Small ribosomal subunit protein uS11 n=1 Tax=Candidatus Liptonbacteria bacterium RIFCSPHIGHO2_01_FULL_57_28 TaxID=1798647 RepID=A0A1G2CAF1_9BACT|nr:MAG: 30S ribosomal protein S11 [Candidatus Liptonbacteria bacterium RIFCSPHIGHO2_01_FULL_57_28]
MKAEASAPAPAVKPVSKKVRNLDKGRAYINATYNNTVISITDMKGNVLAWATAGSLGFSGPKKATPFAASKIVAVVAEKLKAMGVIELEVYVKGIGGGRDSAIRSLANQGFQLSALHDVTPLPHNGPRPVKTRRV